MTSDSGATSCKGWVLQMHVKIRIKPSSCTDNAQVLAWLWPFAASPTIESSLSYKTNGFEGATHRLLTKKLC